jgi:hypothetical protein
MRSSKTIIKSTGRRRGSTPLRKVRQIVAAVLAERGIGNKTRSKPKA